MARCARLMMGRLSFEALMPARPNVEQMDDDGAVYGVAQAECGAFCFDMVAVFDTNMHSESPGGLLVPNIPHNETFAVTDRVTENIFAANDLVTRLTQDIFA